MANAIVTSIVERPVGTTLSAAAGPGDSVLTVDDISRFTWPTGGLRIGSEQFTYTIDAAADQATDVIDIDEDAAGADEAGTITLGGTVVGTYEVDEPVVQFQTTVVTERMATVLLPDQAEELLLRVPRGLWDRLPSNIRERDLAPETVAIEDVGGSWVMTDVVDEDPSIDASFINAATLPTTTAEKIAGTGADAGHFAEAWTAPGNVTANDTTYAHAIGSSSTAVITSHNTGMQLPTAAVNDSGSGSLPWSNPGRIEVKGATASLDTSAFSSIGTGNTQRLQASGFNFAVPPGATITGITVDVTRAAATAGVVFDAIVKLMKAGTIVGTDNSSAGAWSTAFADAIYGGDLWGTTWTPAQVNASDFGVSIQASYAVASYAMVDAVRIRINYTTVSTTSFRSNTNFLAASNFGLAVPPDSTITGITVRVGRHASDNLNDDYATDNQVKLVSPSLDVSTDHAAASHWPTSDAVATYGGDLWGSEWTSDDVNDPDFTVWLSANVNFNVTAFVDYISVTVSYVAAGDF